MSYNRDQIVSKHKKLIGAVLGTDKFDLFETNSNVSYNDKLELGKWELRIPVTDRTTRTDYTIIASFELHPMINCCGICVSTRAVVAPTYRGKGLGTLLNQFRVDVARELGYGLLLCTDIVGNEPQRKILKANGWADKDEFINPRTKNRVAISTIHL